MADHRYVAWLGRAKASELKDEDAEPPCPPRLGELSPALEAFASFLRVDRDLIEAAASASPAPEATDDAALEAWVRALPEAEKTSFLVRLAGGAEAHLRGELLRRFRESRAAQTPAAQTRARTVGEILRAAEARTEERRRREAERAAREQARRERESAEARERHLTALAEREGDAWRELDALIATKQPKKYDEGSRCSAISARSAFAGADRRRPRRASPGYARSTRRSRVSSNVSARVGSSPSRRL